MKSSRHLWLFLAFIGRMVSAQPTSVVYIKLPDFTNAEYYFDQDPGLGAGTPLPSFSTDTIINVTDKIRIPGLSPGLHYFYIRGENAKGVWSVAMGREFLVPNPSSITQSKIVSAEYYFDHDPGVGNGTALPSFTAANTVDITDKVITTGLLPGLHYLYVRGKNANGLWSIVQGREFLIPNSASLTQSNIVSAEYYFDHDPGVGNGTPLHSFTGANTVNLTDSVITSSLLPGLHYLYIRSKNANGVWSIISGREFLIPNAGALQQFQIAKAEYFFDQDPGVGNGIALPSFTAANTINATDKITTAGLSPGLHHLYIRAQNNAGSEWSIVLGQEFQILDTTKLKQSNIVQAEYYYDVDPGVGNGTPVTPSFTSSHTVDTIRKVLVSSGVLSVPGVHHLYMRAKNALGQWSIILSDTFHIEGPLTVTASVTANELCNGNAIGDASASPSGGTSPYTYSWSDGTSTVSTSNPTGSVLSAGTYTITVTDNLGSTGTATVTITQPTAVGISITSVSNVNCNVEGSATANAATGGTSPYTYSWSSGGGTNLTATNLSAGTYTIAATDNHGCSGTASAIITQPASALGITIASVSDVSCHGGNGTATANTATGGTSPYTYSWSSGGGTNLTTTTLSAGTYTISATDNLGCTSTVSATITQPASALGITIASVSDVSCHGGTGSAIANAATGGTSPYTYSWSSGGGTNLATTTVSAGTYTITVTDNHACTATTSTTITQPASSSGITITSVTNVACNTEGSATASAATGGTSPYTYSWSPSGGTNLRATGLSAGAYTITVYDNHGCSSTASATITQAASTLGISLLSVSNISCFGGAGSATAGAATGGNSPYTYSWSPSGGSNPAATGLSAGTYTLNVTDNQGCAVSVFATITEPSSAVGIAISSVNNISCYGGTGSATAELTTPVVTNFSYSYTGNVQNFTVPAGITTVTVSVSGASGGAEFSDEDVTPGGGNGASFTGLIGVTSGHVISIAVGGEGGTSDESNGGGGGGGTFMYDSNTVTALAIAGGGGGSGYSPGAGGAGGSDLTTNNAINGTGGNGANGTGGNGGDSGSFSSYAGAGGGAGWLSNGMGTSINGDFPTYGGDNETLSGHFAGGASTGFTGDLNSGGFGGGGGGSYEGGGGGGGGYNGGGGGNGFGENGGGGGGSYFINNLSLTLPTVIATNTGDGSANISYNTPGGTYPYTYSWSGGGGTNITATGLSAGTYTLTVTDNNGCSATVSCTVSQPAAIEITISSVSNVSCHGGTGSATANAATGGTSPYTYSWSSGGGTNLTITAVSAGTYTIAVTDSHACTATASTTITQPASVPGITITSITNVSCNVEGSATAHAATGGTSPYTYSWSPSGGTNLTATGLGAGTYTITVHDNHDCTATASATITQSASTVRVTIASVSDVSCHGGDGSATANAATGGTSPYTYSWSSGGGTNLTTTAVSAGAYTITATDNHGCTATASATITQPASALGITIASVSDVSCHGGTGTATANAATGGTSPYTYSWSAGGGTNRTTTAVSAGTYTITVTDNHGCTASASATITQSASTLGIAVSSVNNISCYGGTGTVTANAATGGASPYTYSWSPNGGSNRTTSSISAGTYTITVTDNHGCTATASATITQPLSALGISIASVVNVSSFGGSTGSVTANAATGGTSPYTYSWSGGGGTNLTATGLSAGTYTITVSDNNGCSATASATITQPPSTLSITISSVTNVSCSGVDGSATASAATGGTSPYTYSWSGGGGTSLIATGLSAGTYTITVTDNQGATATASTTITQPAIVIASAIVVYDVSCNGGANGFAEARASGGTAPYTYSWTPNTSTTYVANRLSAGIYMVTITDESGCSSTASVTITEPAALTDTVTSMTSPTCAVPTATASIGVTGGVPPYTYIWIPNVSSTATATGLVIRSYVVGVRDANGCTTNVTFSITQPPVLRDSIVRASTINALCNGTSTGSATVGVKYGAPPYTYSWSPNVNSTATAGGLSAGIYSVTVNDASTCSATASVTITQPGVITIKTDSVNETNNSCNGIASVSVLRGGTAPYTYSWATGGQTTATITGQCFGTYCCEITDNNGCTESVCVTIRNATGIENVSNSSAIDIYPNPNEGQFTIAGVESGMIIEVYDYLGRKISAISATQETMHLNISAEANGVYLIRITDKDGILVTDKKIVKIQ